MAPLTAQHSLSPAELSYLHTSLSYPSGPIRPDSRNATQFRPLVAETGILAAANGSARVCWADGGEAVVGVKCEVEGSAVRGGGWVGQRGRISVGVGEEEEGEGGGGRRRGEMGAEGRAVGRNEWVEMSIEIPGYRDDDALPVFLGQMVMEALMAEGAVLRERLWINRRFHWRVFIDILLLSPPLSYPLPLLSLTTHLALLSTRLPRLISEADEDPLFDDDWEASVYLYPRPSDVQPSTTPSSKPPVTLLVISVGQNIIFDPSQEEIAVAEAVVAISVSAAAASSISAATGKSKLRNGAGEKGKYRLLGIRMVDPPARRTTPGIPDSLNSATGGTAPAGSNDVFVEMEKGGGENLWTPPRGGVKRDVFRRMVELVLREGGVAEEVFAGLEGVEV